MFRFHNDYLDPYGIFGGGGRGGRYGYDFYDGDDIYSGRAPVSQRAYKALDDAKEAFLKHLASVDTRAGAVTEEIIKFHLVPDMKKEFNKFVKGYGCTATQRKLTRAEQDKINKTRKSLMIYTSVTVTPTAQQEYLAKNSNKATSSNAVAGGSKSAGAAPSTPQPPPPAPLQTSQNLKRSANAASLTPGPGPAPKKQKK
ncbi:hypothetical protein C8F01DRAFT_1150543 [Mycena amicta]|nr:hypothetical protein C8F01DRAFT_1150543 [Mycena amicta]